MRSNVEFAASVRNRKKAVKAAKAAKAAFEAKENLFSSVYKAHLFANAVLVRDAAMFVKAEKAVIAAMEATV